MDDVGVQEKLECFEDALFYVQPQRQYSAFREYVEYETAFITNKPNVDKKTLSFYQILKVMMIA